MTGEELRKLRMRCGLRRKEASFSSGFSYDCWIRWELGYRPVPQYAEKWLFTFREQQELAAALENLRKENDVLRNRLHSYCGREK